MKKYRTLSIIIALFVPAIAIGAVTLKKDFAANQVILAEDFNGNFRSIEREFTSGQEWFAAVSFRSWNESMDVSENGYMYLRNAPRPREWWIGQVTLNPPAGALLGQVTCYGQDSSASDVDFEFQVFERRFDSNLTRDTATKILDTGKVQLESGAGDKTIRAVSKQPDAPYSLSGDSLLTLRVFLQPKDQNEAFADSPTARLVKFWGCKVEYRAPVE
jgi:hypothetical protein